MSATSWIGKPVRRVEDWHLLTGRGTYIDDHPPVANVHHAAIVRSPHAHARIVGYDLAAALEVDGVVGAITGEDVLSHTKPFSVGVTAPVRYYCAATDKARFVGEPVAVIVAKTRYIAEDAADLVRVDYEPLPAVIDPERALEPDAPVLLDADRDVRRDRGLGTARGRVHRLVQLHGAVHHAPAHRARARAPGEQAPLRRAAGHRRLLRDQDVDLPLHRADRVGG